ncbi:shikimate dehydrogenase [Streptomyces sp. NBC_01304]|uniref:shikimate dehydrogenase n=1 Tax=Streptomyces sp. NBC_01304 TaxID=2903818 RepID=UPI002E124C05|nr:shikimate dehydrogenase [Streptomyces sp. NBC_01304]
MKRLALLGSPVDQALSPALHRAAYAELGLPWTYEAIDLQPDQLGPFLAELDSTWAGFSLTMPLKQTVVDLLDETSATVRTTGTANTIVVTDAGRLRGENTDLHGMLQALADTGMTAVTDVTVLGAGATASTALAAAHRLGCRTATVVTRDLLRSRKLQTAAERIGINIRLRPWTQAAQHLDAGLVIAAVPPHAADSLAVSWPGPWPTLMDVTYRPWPSRLARTAARLGSRVIGGLPMLIHQAAEQCALQTGRKDSVHSAMCRAAEGAAIMDVDPLVE